MKFQRKKIATALGLIGAGGALLLAGAPAQAQDIRVEVTGSSIKRVEAEGALPVQIINRSEIDATGAQSAAELLQFISSNNSGGAISLANTIGATTNSVQTASLRGLGGQNTLVLLNGKRLTQASGEVQGVYGVNLDSIPFSAIERVEVLKDGASAVYGSDAVAGVINFILRKDYQGVEATGYYGAPTRSSGGGGDMERHGDRPAAGDLTKDKLQRLRDRLTTTAPTRCRRGNRDFSEHVGRPRPGPDSDVSGNTFPAQHHHAPPARATRPARQVSSTSIRACQPPLSIVTSEASAHDQCRWTATGRHHHRRDRDGSTSSARLTWQFNPDWQAYADRRCTRRTRTTTSSSRRPGLDQTTVPIGDIRRRSCCRRRARTTRPPLAHRRRHRRPRRSTCATARGLGLATRPTPTTAWQAVVGVKGTCVELGLRHRRSTTRRSETTSTRATTASRLRR